MLLNVDPQYSHVNCVKSTRTVLIRVVFCGSVGLLSPSNLRNMKFTFLKVHSTGFAKDNAITLVSFHLGILIN